MTLTATILNLSRWSFAAVALVIGGCSSVEKAKPTPKPTRIDRSFAMDVPEIMRGTIAAESVVLGYESPGSQGYQPVVARGYGLVVGLNGTGSRDIPPQVRAYMIAQAARGGFGGAKFGEDIRSLSPEELLDSLDTAIVIVEGVVPQGAIEGTKFDVRVYADPRTSTTSLEGGTLYTCDLRPGPPTTGGAQASPLAQARGPVFINPFADPSAVGRDTINRNAGRILNGGMVVKDMPLKLRLANPSHARAQVLQTAINTRFPQEVGRYPGDPNHQDEPTARGESDEILRINVPPSFRGRTDEFIDLLRHTTIAQSNPEVIAMSVRRAMLANPIVANAASLRWQALGPRAIPVIKDLYDHAEEQPRLAALRAGAKLDDPLVIPHLIDMSAGGSPDSRLQAIRLLAVMQLNPRIDLALRKLLDDDDTEVRLESYEALVKRADPTLRRTVVDDKFVVDVIDSSKPLIYITQVGQPRIVLFGGNLEIQRPSTVTAWANRFMIKGELDREQLEIYYRQPDADQGTILTTEPNLEHFLQFLGHTTTVERPAPGLGLSYGETVGALYQMWSQKSIKADFKAEQDRILAAITRIRDENTVAERPEFEDPGIEPYNPDPGGDVSDLGRLEPAPSPLQTPRTAPR